MEIVDVNTIMYIIIIVFIIIFLVANIITHFVEPKYKLKFLEKVLNESPKLFIDKTEEYIQQSKSEVWCNCFRLTKIIGIIRLQDWHMLKPTINNIDLKNLPSTWKENYCDIALNLFMLGMAEDGEYMVNKLRSELSKNKHILHAEMVVFAVKEYYSQEISNSKKVFEELLISKKKRDFHTAIIYYYLGMIADKQSNIKQSKDYFVKAKKFGHNTIVDTKVKEYLNHSMDL